MTPARHTAVIGSGILGLAHAWAAAREGDRVTVFERSERACGASVRNFGMFWPIGQTPELLPTALRSGELWREFSSAMKTTFRACGSACVVEHDDEAAVLEEFSRIAPDLGYDCALWTREQAESRCPGIRKGVAKADCAWLYYVIADADGGHAFAVTLAQHEANIETARAAGLL